MEGFMEQNRNPPGVDTLDPRFKQRLALQTAANAKIAERQRHVLPDGGSCALLSVQVPWAPFKYYLKNKCPEAKPFLWCNKIAVGSTEWVLFFGVEAMEAENRESLWIGVCNNQASAVCAYTKCDLLVPSASTELGDIRTIGEAVDNLVPCGAEVQKSKFGRFWWHKTPKDFEPFLFRGLGDAENEQSFELLLTVKLNPSNPKERTPAHGEDPKLWELSKKYLQPWVTSRCSGVADPLHRRIRELEQAYQRDVAAERERGAANVKAERERAEQRVAALEQQHAHDLKEAKEREDLAAAREQAAAAECAQIQARMAAMEKAYNDLKLHADQVQAHAVKLEASVATLKKEKAALAETVKGHEQNAKAAQEREGQLRQWGRGLQTMVKEAKDAEEVQAKEVRKLEEHVKNTKTRETRYTAAIADLETQLKGSQQAQQRTATQASALQHQLAQSREREDELQASNARLYIANHDERLRTQAMSLSPHGSPSPRRSTAHSMPAPCQP